MRLDLPFPLTASTLGTAAVLAFALTLPAACGGDDSGTDQPTADGGTGSSSGGSSGGSSGSSSGSGSGSGGSSGGSGGSSGGSSGGGSGGGPGPSGCKAITVGAGAKVDGSNADTFAWSDGACAPRTAALIRNDATDGLGEKGGYLRTLTYQADGKTRTATGSGTNGWQGFGYIINHYASTASETQQVPGTYATVLAGPHHAIHQYKWTVSPGGNVDVTAQWVFATGRSHPIFAITFDASKAGSNAVNADSRAPYGDLKFDDGMGGDVAGVAWGDKYKFKTTGGGPETKASAWDYAQTNIVPYDMLWTTTVDAEMGLVQTQTFDQHIGGGDYGGGVLSKVWGKSGTNLLNDVPDWEWPFQLNQYELPFGTTSHRVAWGTNYGAVGQASYTAFGKSYSGYPYQSYSVYVVLGKHTTSAVDAQVAEVETLQGVTLAATRGTVAVDGPAGVGRTDKATYAPVGYDPIYGAWTVDAAGNAATMQFGGGSLTNPIVVLRGYTAATPPTKVTFAGKALAADSDYFATVDAASQRLWITLNRSFAGGELSIE